MADRGPTGEPPEDGPPPGPMPPHNVDAEERLLGSMLQSSDAIADSMALMIPSDFYKPAHAEIFEVICDLTDHGSAADATTVAAAMASRGTLERLGGRRALLRLQVDTLLPGNHVHYRRIVVEAASKRNLIAAGERIREMGYDPEVAAAEGVTLAHDLIHSADVPLGGQPDPNVVEFVAEQHEYRWALPDILERQDRLLLVAPEKYGKSTLIRQVAVCASQGIDPFRFHSIPRCNVVVVDAENPAALVRRKLRPMLASCSNSLDSPFDADRLRICSRTGGIDLTERADEMWLMERLVANTNVWRTQGWGDSPMILCIGPIYKLLEDEDDRRQVAVLQRVLDRVRSRFDCALIMETHAPQESFSANAPPRSLRPYGARRWLRWPEFCRAIEPASDAAAPPGTAEFYDVQGARDERAWPWRLRKGGAWPWRGDDGTAV